MQALRAALLGSAAVLGACWIASTLMQQPLRRRVVRVWTFSNNGMVMACDEAGEQVPEYQGRLEDVEARIRRDFPDAEWMEPFDFAAAVRGLDRP